MKFTLQVSIQNPKKHTKEEITQAVADYCNSNGYKFDVGFYPAEIDIDAIGKA